MNTRWLIENADIPIKRILTQDPQNDDKLLENYEVQYWLSLMKQRSDNNDIHRIHGSHVIRFENILGKCAILGLSRKFPEFNRYMQLVLDFLNKHVGRREQEGLSFGKIYSNFDYETVLSCFLPMLGCGDDPAIQYITDKRIRILNDFTKQKRYDVYVDGSKYKGVKKEWQKHIIDPVLYADGNIALPAAHDYILFAGMYDRLNTEKRYMVETIVDRLFDNRYSDIRRNYGYFYVPGGSYNVKAVIYKMHFPNLEEENPEDRDLSDLIFSCFVLSHFETARKSDRFRIAIKYLERYKTENNRYVFPKPMITEKKDSCVIFGGHMNVGENKRSKLYSEILSTFWMDRILSN
jgi:hypothetical protein